MRNLVFLIFLLLNYATSFSQSEVRIKITNEHTGHPVSQATVRLGTQVVPTDTTGVALFSGVAEGQYAYEISHVGFHTISGSLLVKKDSFTSVEYQLSPDEEEEEEEVIIESTRSTRSIRNIPTRIEFIAGEELDEKSNMKPGDIRMLLTESTGIQTQQTSATSANAAIRIQGLDGRYTQILKDGIPSYAGMGSGLGLLQTPPLDLKQIEVIKGSASTLYGGGAIAGLVNLISKTPTDERELRFHLDATSAGGLNTSGFYGQKFNKLGLTVFLARNSNAPYDPAGIGLTAIPKFERYTLNPRLFYYFSPRTKITMGVSFIDERERIGGDIEFIKGNKPSGFYESNRSDRLNTQFIFDHRFSSQSALKLKYSFNKFRRDLTRPSYRFWGTQRSDFAELSYTKAGEKHEWIGGASFINDRFREYTAFIPNRDYDQLSIGAFVQNSWSINEKISLETGLRGEHVKDYGFILLPRISALFRISPKLSSRIGGGLGYKTPNFFTEESERLHYENVYPVDENVNTLERSYGVNADINYKTVFAGGEIDFSINQLFFYTRIHDPLILQPFGPYYRYNNVTGHFDSKGLETNMKFGYHDFKLFLGYTFTHAYLHEGIVEKQNQLTPKHRLNSVLLYEVEEKWKVGLEAYYFGRQLLSDGSYGESYWITGFMVEKLWEKFSLYINFENFLDTRQTRMGPIYNGSLSNPVFNDIYAPLDGFVVNGGLKLRL